MRMAPFERIRVEFRNTNEVDNRNDVVWTRCDTDVTVISVRWWIGQNSKAPERDQDGLKTVQGRYTLWRI